MIGGEAAGGEIDPIIYDDIVQTRDTYSIKFPQVIKTGLSRYIL